MQEGKIMKINSPAGITESFTKPLWSVRSANMYALMVNLRSLDVIDTCYPFGQYHHVVFKDEITLDKAKQMMSTVASEELEVNQITATIEDCFMELMRK